MTETRAAQRVEWIPIDRINVVNPRLRNKRVFKEIVDNIAQIGLKRPITVTRRDGADGPVYDLVCGQGRLEAYQALGQTDVPALVVVADAEDCLIASLVENCARRQHRAIDLLQDIGAMRGRGYSAVDIAHKTGPTPEYVHAVAHLLECGEQRLLRAVEARQIPSSVAVDIAGADDLGVQRALQDADEKGYCAVKSCWPSSVWSNVVDKVARAPHHSANTDRAKDCRPQRWFVPIGKIVTANVK